MSGLLEWPHSTGKHTLSIFFSAVWPIRGNRDFYWIELISWFEFLPNQKPLESELNIKKTLYYIDIEA